MKIILEFQLYYSTFATSQNQTIMTDNNKIVHLEELNITDAQTQALMDVLLANRIAQEENKD